MSDETSSVASSGSFLEVKRGFFLTPGAGDDELAPAMDTSKRCLEFLRGRSS